MPLKINMILSFTLTCRSGVPCYNTFHWIRFSRNLANLRPSDFSTQQARITTHKSSLIDSTVKTPSGNQSKLDLFLIISISLISCLFGHTILFAVVWWTQTWFKMLWCPENFGKNMFNIYGFMQERRISIANGLELRLSCTNLCFQLCANWWPTA